jgi:hypothetical protein
MRGGELHMAVVGMGPETRTRITLFLVPVMTDSGPTRAPLCDCIRYNTMHSTLSFGAGLGFRSVCPKIMALWFRPLTVTLGSHDVARSSKYPRERAAFSCAMLTCR